MATDRKAYMQKYYRDHAEQLKAASRAYREKNKEKKLASDKQYRLAHQEKIRTYKQVHREKFRADWKIYYRKNRRSLLDRHLQWRKQNPESHRHTEKQRRRAKRYLGKVPLITISQWEAIKKAYGFRCVYCQKKKPLTMDHVVPLSKGGTHIAENIVSACRSCNSSKGNREAPSYQPVLL